MSNDQNLISTEALGDASRDTLAALLSTMLPANAEMDLPPAGDPLIVDDILASIRAGSFSSIVDGLQALDEAAIGMHECSFSDIEADARTEVFESFQHSHSGFVRLLGSIALQCYYRDDRVMESLGMEARAPFPEGFEIEQGDWSLLDPVKEKGPIYKVVE